VKAKSSRRYFRTNTSTSKYCLHYVERYLSVVKNVPNIYIIDLNKKTAEYLKCRPTILHRTYAYTFEAYKKGIAPRGGAFMLAVLARLTL
jgi:hypothetical protein